MHLIRLFFGAALLLLCLLAAKGVVSGTGLPIAPPVLGMFFLTLILVRLGQLPDGLEQVSTALLRYLTLLFVPAGVGTMLYFDELRGQWLSLLITLILSTVIAMAATAWLLNKLLLRSARKDNA